MKLYRFKKMRPPVINKKPIVNCKIKSKLTIKKGPLTLRPKCFFTNLNKVKRKVN